MTACDPARDEGRGELPAKTPLQEVEGILAVDPPSREPVAVEPAASEVVKPAVPVAKAVPDKPGFVISPYNGKWIDVTGVAPGELMLDPHFPAGEKKHFRVPEAPKAETPRPEVPVEDEESAAGVESPEE